MFRNVESHFATVPQVEKPRSMFGRPKTHKTSFNVGDLIPNYFSVVYPGDTIKMRTSSVVRLQTLLTPVMDNMYLDQYFFFVPMRLVWSHTKEFFGENTQSDWVPQVTYQIPTISAPSGGFNTGTIADYLGLPVGVTWSNTDKNAPMALPFRVYALCASEFFRDQNVTDPLNIPIGDANQTGSNGTNYITDVANGGAPFKVAKYHDYWTSMLPGPLKAADPVKFPLISGTMAPVGTRTNQTSVSTGFNTASINFKPVSGSISNGTYGLGMTFTNDVASGHAYSDSHTSAGLVYPSNLWTDLSNTVGSVTVNQLRLAFQLQRYFEALARGGSRYTEFIKTMFGVTPADASLQRPQYLGGKRIPIAIHEVTNAAQSAQDFLGDLGAMSRTSDVSDSFVNSFTEMGFVIGLCCARYDHTYCQGIEPWWLRKTAETWYNPIFATIGEQPVGKVSIYADGNMNSDSVFGYQEAWADLRYEIPMVTGEMRPGVSNSLASWHFADYYTQSPTLSDGWIREDKSNVDRTLAVTSANANQVFGDFLFDATWTRVLPMYSVPGLIDHH